MKYFPIATFRGLGGVNFDGGEEHLHNEHDAKNNPCGREGKSSTASLAHGCEMGMDTMLRKEAGSLPLGSRRPQTHEPRSANSLYAPRHVMRGRFVSLCIVVDVDL